MRTYGQTKLSNLLFMLGLNARAPWLKVLAAHPGGGQTELQRHGLMNKLAMKVVEQSASEEALPSLRAATEDAPAGTYFGPGDVRGAPVVVTPPFARARRRSRIEALGSFGAADPCHLPSRLSRARLQAIRSNVQSLEVAGSCF